MNHVPWRWQPAGYVQVNNMKTVEICVLDTVCGQKVTSLKQALDIKIALFLKFIRSSNYFTHILICKLHMHLQGTWKAIEKYLNNVILLLLLLSQLVLETFVENLNYYRDSMAICDQIQETLEGHVVTLEKIDSGNWDILVKTRDQELCQLKDNKLNRKFQHF